MDAIRLRGLQCWSYSGVFEEERRLGQRFCIDIDLELDLRAAGASDALADTLDYGEAIREVRTLVETRQFQLIEAMAEAIAAILKRDRRVERVRVVVSKPQPPIPGFTGSVAVEIWR